MNRRFAVVVLVAALWPAIALSVAPAASAQGLVRGAAVKTVATKTPTARPQRIVRFSGQVMALDGMASSPSGFQLQIGARTVDFRIMTTGTVFTPRTAEAQVVGFGQYDFALVSAIRANNEWTALRVTYDVVPFGPIRDFLVTGRILNIDKKGKNIQLRLASGDTHWVRVTINTRFELDGVPADATLVLTRDASVVVAVHRNPENVWFATTINEKSSSPSH